MTAAAAVSGSKISRRRCALGSLLITLVACSGGSDAAKDPAESEAQTWTTRTPPARYALVIGIGRYPDRSDSLPGPPQDAAAFADLLVAQHGFVRSDIRTLIDQNATRERILAEFQGHLQLARRDDLVVIYFSGHGVQLDENFGVKDPEPSGADQGLYVWGRQQASVILDDELGHLLRTLRTRRILVVTDACFSGSLAHVALMQAGAQQTRGTERTQAEGPEFFEKGRMARVVELPDRFVGEDDARGLVYPSPSGTTELAELGSFALLSASEEHRRAFSVKNWPKRGEARSVFTYYLGDAMGRLGKGKTFRELIGLTREAVKRGPPCRRYKLCQVPQATGEYADSPVDLILGTP